MNRFVAIMSLMVILTMTGTHVATAKGYRFSYKLRPGQQWVATSLDRSESQFMGKPTVSQQQRRYAYRINKGVKKGWVKIEGRIVFSPKDAAAKMLADARFYADMHRSGELRQLRADVPPPPSPNPSQMPPQFAAMQAQSGQYMADMFKQAVFWFPEFPEEALQLGDEFDMIRKSRSNMGQGTMAVQTAIKEIFTLEEVADGLAYFSVKVQSMSKMTGPTGAPTNTTTASKGEAVFDLKLGMWIEMTTKTRARVKMDQNASPMESLNISKMTMGLK